MTSPRRPSAAISRRHAAGRAKNIRTLLIIALTALGILWLGGLAGGPAQPAASAIRPGNRHVKQLRTIVRRKTRAVCGQSRPRYARCLAEVTLGNNGQPLAGTPASSGSFGPAQFHTAYNLPCTPGGVVASVCSTPGSFGPETIAIVDAGNFSTGSSGLESSLQNYDQFYGLPTCSIANGCLDVVNQSGSTSPLPSDAGWSDEIALDVETAHMICQTCKVVLVEASSATLNNLATANATAAALGPVSISNSWGSSTDDPALDSKFEYPGIAEIASTGDSGTVSSGPAWPSDNPAVIAAAGTTLSLNTDNSWASETVWANSGGGCSNYYAAPSWQTSLSQWSSNGCGSYRAFGDVSADADPNTGAAININSTWYEIGGTSLSSPLIAGIFALTGGMPASTDAVTVPYNSFTGSDSHDITSGNDCTTSGQPHCTAAAGFDTPSGLGSPNGVSGFASLPSQPGNLTATTISQSQVDLSWTASTASGSISGYHIYRDGVEISTTTATSYNDTGLTPNTSYSYEIIAYDTSGNNSLASTVTAIASYPADINQDGHIDLLDLSLLASKYGQSGAGLGRSDINLDGRVDLLDLSLLAGSYGSE